MNFMEKMKGKKGLSGREKKMPQISVKRKKKTSEPSNERDRNHEKIFCDYLHFEMKRFSTFLFNPQRKIFRRFLKRAIRGMGEMMKMRHGIEFKLQSALESGNLHYDG